MLAGSESADSGGKCVADDVRIEFVVQSRMRVGPGTQTPSKGCQIATKAVLGFILRSHRRVQPKNLPDQGWECDNVEPLVRGAEPIKIIPSKRGQIARIRHVQDPFCAGRVGRMPKGGGLPRTR